MYSADGVRRTNGITQLAKETESSIAHCCQSATALVVAFGFGLSCNHLYLYHLSYMSFEKRTESLGGNTPL